MSGKSHEPAEKASECNNDNYSALDKHGSTACARITIRMRQDAFHDSIIESCNEAHRGVEFRREDKRNIDGSAEPGRFEAGEAQIGLMAV